MNSSQFFGLSTIAYFLAMITYISYLAFRKRPIGIVVFAHGSGSSRHSPRNRYVAEVLNRAGIGTLLFDLLTPAEDEEVLKSFYRQVRPWGFWGPVLAKVLEEDPTFQRNRDFKRDAFNIVIGIVWQTSLVILPVSLVIRKFNVTLIALGVVIVTALILKKTWYDHLEERETMHAPSAPPAAASPVQPVES